MKYTRYLPLLYQMFRKKNPVQLTLFVTNRCNLSCRMCLNYKDLNSKTTELNVEELEAITRSMKPLLWVIFSGGEPFIRRDLSSIAKLFAQHTSTRNISLPTNGCLLDSIVEQTTRMLVENPEVFFNVNLSILGLGAAHDAITQREGSFDDLVKTRWALESLRKRYMNFRLSTTITYSGYNHESILKTVDWVLAELRTDSVNLNLTRGDTAEAKAKEYGIDNFVEGTRRILMAYRERRIGYDQGRVQFFLPYYEAYYNRLIKEYEGGRFISRCHAGRSTVVITAEGDVYPCEMLARKFGNLRDVNYDFGTIWHSPEVEAIRRWIYSSKCRCFHGCNVSTNLLVEPRYLLPITAKAIGRSFTWFQ